MASEAVIQNQARTYGSEPVQETNPLLRHWQAERRRRTSWITTLTGFAVLIIVLAYLILRDDPADQLFLATSLAVLLALIAFTWHKAMQFANAMMLEASHSTSLERETEAELRTLQFEYRDIFHSHPTPMWIFELSTLHILAVNDAACAQYGYSRAELLRMNIRQLRQDSAIPALDSYLSMPHSALQNAGIWKHRRKDGSLLDVEIVSHELDWRGRKVRLVVATDVTQRILAERRLNELNANLASLVNERTQKVRRYAHKLRQRKRELEIVNRDLEMFSYSASHDLRTPLFVINIFIDMLLQDFAGKMPEEAADHMRKIQTATHNMTALVDDLMKLAKVSKHAAQKRQTDLGELATTQVATLRSKDPGRKVTVQIQEGMQVNADPGLLTIALENLIGNAWKYSGYVPEACIEVGRYSAGEEEVFFVRDNGAGFDMQDARDLFKPFYRMHGEDKFEGTGIGLAIVQRVMALHGGRVWAEAQVNKGATFYFTLDPGPRA